MNKLTDDCILTDLNKFIINENSTKMISKEFAHKYHIIPLNLTVDKIYVAMIDTLNEELLSLIRLLTRREVVPYKASEEQIVLAIKTYYGKNFTVKNVEDLKQINKTNKKYNLDDNVDTKAIQEAPAVKLIDFIINQALMKGASDIHIEPQEDMVNIRYRTDGVLLDILDIPLDTYSIVSTRIKIMASMDISEKRSSQDGKIKFRAGDTSYDLRISSLPTIYGEKFVIRILYKSTQLCSLEALNLNKEDYALIKNILKHNHGMVLVTGPTGSGKSTTLYAMLNEINGRDKNITTIEDPVELSLKGINQVNVNTKAKVTFANGLRNILRQDPDIIMIGEIRDEETASIAVRAAITGHLVFSTLHTNDALGAIHRLNEMGVPRYLLGDALIAVIAQRLVRKICPQCKTDYFPSTFEAKILEISQEDKLHIGKGCLSCNMSGYAGRCAVCEVLYLSSSQRTLILKEENDELFRHSAVENKMKFLLDNCKDFVKNGITTFEELIRLSNGELG